jgi:hypothetical protein
MQHGLLQSRLTVTPSLHFALGKIWEQNGPSALGCGLIITLQSTGATWRPSSLAHL